MTYTASIVTFTSNGVTTYSVEDLEVATVRCVEFAGCGGQTIGFTGYVVRCYTGPDDYRETVHTSHGAAERTAVKHAAHFA